jgi:hypothetical protein
MAYSFTTGAKWALKAITGSSLISDVDAWAGDFRDQIEALVAAVFSGPLGSLPTSSTGTPGKFGRLYYATNTDADAQRLLFDTGTGWLNVSSYQEGLAGALPAIGPKGALYRATDADRAWIGTGSGWLELAVGSSAFAGVAVSNGSQAIAAAANQPVLFGTEDWDPDGMHDASASERVTVVTAGTYDVRAKLTHPESSSATFTFDLIHHAGGTDTVIDSYTTQSAANPANTPRQLERFRAAAAGDFFWIRKTNATGVTTLTIAQARLHALRVGA